MAADKRNVVQRILLRMIGISENDFPKGFVEESTSLSVPIYTHSYNGEKDLGEIGPIRNYLLDYAALRARAWQSFTESEVTQTVLKKYRMWVIGAGLRLRCDPSSLVLKGENINNFNKEEFNEIVEQRFNLFCKSKKTDYQGLRSLNRLASRAYLSAIVGGDVLVIQRYEDNGHTVQIIDGARVVSPPIGMATGLIKGNTIKHGIELSPKGEHVAYYVSNGLMVYERIAAKTITGLQQAFLVYGGEYRIDSVRGLPLIGTVLETLKKLERYKEATVGSAEERQKIILSIEHDAISTEENPFAKQFAKARDASNEEGEIPADTSGRILQDTVVATTNKQTINLPKGAKLQQLVSTNELSFKDFYTTNVNLVCAAIGIPPEVALSKYDSNFSASRAALKDWEHTINVSRADISEQFYQPIYDFYLQIEILRNRIDAPGYLDAMNRKNNVVIDAYHNARFVGASIPHIDPLKEVNAERAKLGPMGANIPLTTVEDATEALNGGDSDNNAAQFAEELKEAERLGFGPTPPPEKTASDKKPDPDPEEAE